MVWLRQDFDSRRLFWWVRRVPVVGFPCCEAGAAVFRVAMMTCVRRSGHEDLHRCKYCICPLRILSSESELPVLYATSRLFGICVHGLHEAAAAMLFLMVVLQ